MAMHYVRYTIFSGWEPEVRRIRDYAEKGVAIDVGANLGLWSYALAKTGIFDKIISYEPNKELTIHLINANLKGLTVINKAVSSKAGGSRLRIPRQGKVRLTGWASLESFIDLDASDYDEIACETIRLDDQGLKNVSFIKIDVEGHELNVLTGARELLSTFHPTCIIECRDRNRQLIEAFFADLGVGYRMVDTQSEYGFPLSPGNLLFSTT